MSTFELDIPIPDQYKEDLIRVIEECDKKKCISFSIREAAGSATVHIEDTNIEVHQYLRSNAFNDIASFGLLTQYSPAEKYCLTAKGREWFKYQKKNEVQKWFARNPNLVKNLFILISFILALAANLATAWAGFDVIFRALRLIP